MDKRKIIIAAIMFFITAVVITAIIPSGGKYMKSFRVGDSWRYETLVAPFDFSIEKSDAEIAADRRSVDRNFIPVYRYDTAVNKHINLIMVDYGVTSEIVDIPNPIDAMKSGTITANQAYGITLEHAIRYIYQKGVAANLDKSAKKDNQELQYIRIDKNATLSTLSTKEIFTPSTAREYVTNKLTPVLLAAKEANLSLNTEPNIDKYIIPNITFSETLNAAIKDDDSKNIALTKGIVHENELIVSQKQVIDENTFSKLSSLKSEYERRLGGGDRYPWVLAGHFFAILIILTITFFFLSFFKTELLYQRRNVFFILLLFTIMTALCSMVDQSNVLNIYLIPFAIVPIYVMTFYGIRMSIFEHICVLVLCSLIVPKPLEFFFINFVAGIVGVFVLGRSYRREMIFMAAGTIFISYVVSYIAMTLVQYGTLAEVDPWSFAWFGVNALLFLGMYQLLYVIEKGFGFVSNVSLLELCDTNQKLLLELAHKAPGTFQHTLQVANLAEAVAKEIGANALLARTGALYHDIGKMNNPNFFIENNSGTFNPHDDITAIESAEIIRKHVTDGVALARKQGIPSIIIDFITGHHGDSMIYYFYSAHKEKFGEVIDENIFRYPGPKPISKEVAICMIADSVEAASRSLTNYTAEVVDTLVDKIIDIQINENQLSESKLSFRDISTIKSVLKNKLTNIYHTRITYPERN